jgi:hypothetical protein
VIRWKKKCSTIKDSSFGGFRGVEIPTEDWVNGKERHKAI